MMNKILKGIILLFALFFIIGAFAGEDPDTLPQKDIPTQAQNQPEKTLSSTVDLTKEDREWRADVNMWIPIVAKDIETLGESLEKLEYKYVDDDARLLRQSCTMALKASKKHNVSLEMSEAKEEYEKALQCFMNSADDMERAMEIIEKDDTAALKLVESATTYAKTGSVHLEKVIAHIKKV